ncbi:MAG TPA: DUF4388 domain-containing protein [Iamia sp.]|nr:DUF4388 domain-containing protein [Iamia sp.]
MALQGTLDTFALADLVRLLATTGKTGELAIDGDRGSGRLWFADGQLVGGEPAADDLVDVVFALLRTEEGDFAFHADTAPEAPGEPESALDVLAAAEARLEEWRPVEALVPSPRVAVTLRAELAEDEVVVGRDRWRQLVAVAGGTTAADLGTALGLDEAATGFVVRDLVDAGLVEVGDEVEVADEVEEPIPDPLAVVTPLTDPSADLAGPTADADAEADLAGPDLGLGADGDPAEDPFVDPAAEGDPADGEAVTTGEPTPVLGVVPEPPYSFGSWGEGPVPAPEVQADPSSLGPWEPLTPVGEPATPVAALPDLDAPVETDDLGSYAVDLDSQLGSATAGHSYLGTAPEGGTSLPEPLLGAGGLPDSDAAALSAPPEPPAPASTPEPGTGAADEVATRRDHEAADPWAASDAPADLGVPLDSLSPAAARALTAAASADARATDDDTDAGRRVLRRIISTGKG